MSGRLKGVVWGSSLLKFVGRGMGVVGRMRGSPLFEIDSSAYKLKI